MVVLTLGPWLDLVDYLLETGSVSVRFFLEAKVLRIVALCYHWKLGQT